MGSIRIRPTLARATFESERNPGGGWEPIGSPYQGKEREGKTDRSSLYQKGSNNDLPDHFFPPQKQMDIFDELQGYSSVPYENVPTPTNTPIPIGHHFSAPSFRDAKQIWTECAFGYLEATNTIQFIVREWAKEKGYLQEDMITWTADSGIRYKSAWPAFIKWFFLQCKKVR
jgi:hypothetical protein